MDTPWGAPRAAGGERREPSAPGHGADDHERVFAGFDGGGYVLGQWRVWRFVGQVLLARVAADERPPASGRPVPDRAAQHRIALLQGIQEGALGEDAGYVQPDLAVDLGQVLQVRRQHDPDLGHGRTWTSTERTAGRSRAIGDHVSPESGPTKTCPTV